MFQAIGCELGLESCRQVLRNLQSVQFGKAWKISPTTIGDRAMFRQKRFSITLTNQTQTNSISTQINNSTSKLIEYFDRSKKIVERLENSSNIHIATLGPKGTSSEAAACYLLKTLKKTPTSYLLFSSYEEACDNLSIGPANLLLVANAYKAIDKIYMNANLKLLLSFMWETPLYGLAKKKESQLVDDRPLKIATHHAPSSLIPWFSDKVVKSYKIVEVNSTSEAAIQVIKGDSDLCLTNMNAVDRYGLEFMSRLRPICMLWSVFALRKNQEDNFLFDLDLI